MMSLLFINDLQTFISCIYTQRTKVWKQWPFAICKCGHQWLSLSFVALAVILALLSQAVLIFALIEKLFETTDFILPIVENLIYL